MSHFTGKKVHSVIRLINTPMKIWAKYQMMNCQSKLRKMNPIKTGKVGVTIQVLGVKNKILC